MGRMETYKIGLSIHLRHEYYANGICPVSVTPDARTARCFSRFDILLRKHTDGVRLLVKEDFRAEDLTDEDARFHFELRPQDALLYYVTQAVDGDETFSLNDSSTPAVWKELEINAAHIAAGKQSEITVNIQGVERYYEYLCIPKYNPAGIRLKMTEEKNRAGLTEAEQVSLPDIPVVYRFTTLRKVKLRQNSALRMYLWEVRESGEREISKTVPNPQPDQFSPIRTPETVATFFYF